jgi:hypothetical protein
MTGSSGGFVQEPHRPRREISDFFQVFFFGRSHPCVQRLTYEQELWNMGNSEFGSSGSLHVSQYSISIFPATMNTAS